MPVCPRCGSHAERAGELCENDQIFFVEDEALAEAPGDDLLGRYVGDRFAVMSLLGGGGMGKVYNALQFPVRRRVALKVLKSSLADNPRFLQRFEREAQAIAALNHPNIVTLFDFGADSDGIHYIAMEYVEGRLLTPFLREPLEIAFVIHVAAQVLAALQEAHGHGIIHRDLKPDNVMITSVGGDDVFIKVLDFGLAQLATEDVAITAAGEVFGTPLYMSPEQAAGEEIGPPADLYSLACIIYELLTGRPPFQGTRPMNVLMKHVNAPVPPMQLKPGLKLSPALEGLVMRCLAKHPHERYPSARAMLDAIFQTPEGRVLATSVPSMNRSLELPMITGSEGSRHTMPGGGAMPTGVDLAPPAGTPLNTTMPPTQADSLPVGAAGGVRRLLESRQRVLAMAGGGVALVALVVTLVVLFSGESGTNDVNAADARVESSELGAVTRARVSTHRALRRAELELQADFVFTPVRDALTTPGSFKPDAVRVRESKIKGEPWLEQVKIFHRMEVSTSSYTDPAELLFGD